MSQSVVPDRRSAFRTDEDLVAGVLRSDEASFDALYDRYYQRVYNFVYLRMRNRADAEEVLQETFTAVFQGVSGFRGRSTVRSWIYGIAKNTVNNHIRRAVAQDRRIERAASALVRHLEGSMAGTPEDALTLRRCTDSVCDEFERLPGWQSDIFAMRHVENLRIAEISARTSRSPDAVRSSLCRVKRLVVSAVENGHASHAGGSAA